MAWTDITRRHYEPPKGRYASDLSDVEWALIEPMLPAARRLGRPRTVDLREVVNALLFIAKGRAANGGFCRRTSRPSRRFSIISINGATANSGGR